MRIEAKRGTGVDKKNGNADCRKISNLQCNVNIKDSKF